MKFTYETQGAITYLVCELEPTEQLDTLTLGMLSNNHIQGLASVLYTEMNGQRFLKYNISAKVTAEQFFSGNMDKQRTLTAFNNILNAFCSADEYMIDPNCFSVVPEHIFLNVSNCETALICVPVTVSKDVNAEIANLFKKILISSQFEQSKNDDYVAQLIACVNDSQSFSAYNLRDLVFRLQMGNSGAAQRDFRSSAPVSSLNSTISIDTMPTPPISRPQPVQQTVPKQNFRQQPAPAAKPISTPIRQQPAQQNNMARPASSARQPGMRAFNAQNPQTNIPKPPVNNGPGFAIPGQPAGGVTAPAKQPKPAKAKKEKKPAEVPTTGEKKMSFFDLLSHYSKENAAIYKAQKEAEKQAKNAKTLPNPAMPIQGKQPPISQNQGKNPVGGIPTQSQPAYTQPQYRPPVQPIPVQNSFNETTVLSPVMSGGETTVLGVAPGVAYPYLIRVKTGERININKPVFRIGKEKSYVDYFIGDNTAISRSHCNIHSDNSEYFIEDTNSTNHTYVNGNLITSNVKTKLTSGDKIRLANEDFTFSV